MEDISLGRLLDLHPKIRESAMKAYKNSIDRTPEGVHPFITQTGRSFEESQTLYNQGRTTPGQIVTRAKPGQSYHNYYLALDFVLMVGGKMIWKVDDNWMIVVQCFREYGFFWGGDFTKFKDYPHLENRLGYHWSTLLELYTSNKFISGTKYLDIS